MAKPRTDGAYTNPDVRHERTDVDVVAVVKAGAWLLGVIVASAVLTLWLASYLTKIENEEETAATLPVAKVDATRDPLPPVPLEALEDVRERKTKNFAMYPPRADQSPAYRDDKKNLETWKPIDKGVAAAKELFPVRKGDAEATKAPTNYNVQLPSKSSAGRETTGGQ